METSVSIYISNIHPYATEKDILSALKVYGNGDDSIIFRNIQNGTCSILKFNFEGDAAIDNLIVLHADVVLTTNYSYTLLSELFGGIPKRVNSVLFIQIIRNSTITEKSSIQYLSEINQEIQKSKALEEQLAESIFAFEE
jgi:UDP-2,3-diacylglucosamine pyrophosphatase LpxH